MTYAHSLCYVPLGYTYKTRLRNYRGALGFIAREVLPLAITLMLAYHLVWWLVLVLFLGYMSFYECGYLWNDLADSSTESGGDRLAGVTLRFSEFVFVRILVLGLSSYVLFRVNGWNHAAIYFAANISLVFFLILHTSRGIRDVRFLRLLTFTALAFYKYLPVLLPMLPWSEARALMMAIFLCYGLGRVIVYALRKYGDVDARAHCEPSSLLLQSGFLLLFAPLFLGVNGLRNWPKSGPFDIWISFTLITMGLTGLHKLRQLFIQKSPLDLV
jgi:hypothetical protein